MALGWLIPRPDEPGAALARRTRLFLTVFLSVSNLGGAAIVFALGAWVFPLPDIDDPDTARLAGLAVTVGYLLVFMPLGALWGLRRLRHARGWLEQDRAPTPGERRIILQAPRRITFVHAVIWALAALLFGVLGALFSLEAGQRVLLLVLFGGITTCAFVYLVTERAFRRVATRALASGIGDQRIGPGITTRALMAWALGSAVPVLGLMGIALSTLVEHDFSTNELAGLVLALGGLMLAVGFVISLLAARAIADPVISLRKATAEVGKGELEVEVPVYDGSEVGQLQAGFNDMVAGLREREHIRDLFGRHVGADVARSALEEGVELGGETRDVAVLFTDIIGSTRVAAERPAHEVVELLNRFFGIVVEVVHRHGGWVNKFEGDAALAVFGAPAHIDGTASKALAAARELSERLRQKPIGVEAAIGVSAGEVVAGNIGEERRFEYTVIGDPVNEAARLTELAKEHPQRLLASEEIVSRADEREAPHWRLAETVELRGRSRPTRLAVPATNPNVPE